MENFKGLLQEAGLAEETDFRGMSDVEITAIEAERGISLPSDYKEFLRGCGRSAGKFGVDIDIFFPYFLQLNEAFLESAEEFGIPFRPPSDAFFFSAYQGGWFHYFVCGSADSSIYVLNEGDCRPTFVASSFTAFMVDAISSYQDALARVRESKSL